MQLHKLTIKGSCSMIVSYLHTRTCQPCMIRTRYVLVYIYYHMFSHVLFLLSLVFFYIVWCILPRYFYTDFWSSCQPVSREVASLTEKLEIPCVSLLSIRNLDHLYEGFQQMETFCCRRLRYLLLWVLVFWKLRRLSGQPAEAKAQAYRYLLRGLLGHRKTILGPSTDGQSSKKACWLFLLSLSGPWIVPSTCSFFYSHQSRRLPSTAFFTLSSGCIRLQEWILLPYTPSAVFSAKVGALRLEGQPASHGKEPLEVTHLKQLVERTDFGNLLQLGSLVMFVLAFSGFFRSSELCQRLAI